MEITGIVKLLIIIRWCFTETTGLNLNGIIKQPTEINTQHVLKDTLLLLLNCKSYVIIIEELQLTKVNNYNLNNGKYLPLIYGNKIEMMRSVNGTKMLVEAMNFNCEIVVLSVEDICETFTSVYEAYKIYIQRKPRKYIIMQPSRTEYETDLLNCSILSFFSKCFSFNSHRNNTSRNF